MTGYRGRDYARIWAETLTGRTAGRSASEWAGRLADAQRRVEESSDSVDAHRRRLEDLLARYRAATPTAPRRLRYPDAIEVASWEKPATGLDTDATRV